MFDKTYNKQTTTNKINQESNVDVQVNNHINIPKNDSDGIIFLEKFVSLLNNPNIENRVLINMELVELKSKMIKMIVEKLVYEFNGDPITLSIKLSEKESYILSYPEKNYIGRMTLVDEINKILNLKILLSDDFSDFRSIICSIRRE